MLTSIKKQLNKFETSITNHIQEQFNESLLDYKFSCSDIFECKKNNNGEFELLYKSQVAAKSPDEIKKVFNELKDSKYLAIDRPYFVDNIESIRKAIDNGEKIAIEGGPCLFGQDEVCTIVILSDGSKFLFDYSTGRKSDSNQNVSILSSELEFFNFIINNSKNITDIQFVNNKKGVTIDEYESIEILFDFASKLSCPLVMPIVDMSYQKYLDFATKGFDEKIRKKALYDLKQIVHDVADMYIDVTENISKKYQNVEYLILHERNEKLLDLYYKRRSPFIERNKIIHSLTDVELRLEPIKDYCTMPALPYYFYDIKNIIQIDSLDETDSHRKCKKAHKNVLNICAILYPERIYENGMTMFNSQLVDKKYIHEK